MDPSAYRQNQNYHPLPLHCIGLRMLFRDLSKVLFRKYVLDTKKNQRGKQRCECKLQVEPLEDRQMLTTFFVDGPGGNGPGGSNSNDGLAANRGFATIQHAVDLARPGDTVLLRGGTYREQVSIPRSGTASNPIVIQAFAPGGNPENVTVTATDRLTGFTRTPETNDNGNVFVANLAGSTTNPLLNRYELTVFVNGQVVQEAKSRNSADELDISTWDTYDSLSGTTLIDNSRSVPFNNNIVGAYLNVRINAFVTSRHRIVAASGNTLTLDRPVSANSRRGQFYLIHDARSLVDSPGEWYFSEETNQFFLWAPGGGDPDNVVVEVSRRAEAFDTNGNDHLHFRNLRLTGGDLDTTGPGSNNNSNNLLIDGVQFIGTDRNSGPDFGTTRTALVLTGNNNRVINSTFRDIWSVGVRVNGRRNIVSNNLFVNTSFNGGGSGGVAHGSGAIENLISFNTFNRSGRAAITGNGGAYNDTDLGNSVIRFNTIHDTSASPGAGIYTDNEVSNLIIHNNIIYSTRNAGLIHNTPNSFILAFNNTLFDTQQGGFVGPFESELGAGFGSRFYNNITTGIPDRFNLQPAPWDIRNNIISSSAGNFVNASSQDFRLRSGSAAVNSGIVIPGITDGFRGSAPDVGAIELGDAQFRTGHNFASQPSASELTYRYSVIPFTDRFVNGGFELGLNGWTVAGGSPTIVTDSTRDHQSEGLGVFGNNVLQLQSGDSVSQVVRNLRPNTNYTIAGFSRPFGEVRQAEDGISSLPVVNYRGQTDVGQLRNGNVVRFNNVDFGSGSPLYNQLQIGLATADSGTTVQVFLDRTSGSPVATFQVEDPNNFILHNVTRANLPNITGTHDVFLRFTGSGDLGLFDAIRFANSNVNEEARVTVSNFGGSTVSQNFGTDETSGRRDTVQFRTGNSTTARITIANPSGRQFDQYIDAISVAETGSFAGGGGGGGGTSGNDITVNTNQTTFAYDLGTRSSPLFGGTTNGQRYQRITPNTSGDVFWSGSVNAVDRGASAGVNAINRDLIFSRNTRTLNHRVANGRWEVLVQPTITCRRAGRSWWRQHSRRPVCKSHFPGGRDRRTAQPRVLGQRRLKP